jgi:CIC family chloride channel protein
MVPESMRLEKIVRLLTTTQQSYFPVVNSAGKMIGIFSGKDLRSFLYSEHIWQLANARDIMVGKVVVVTPEDDLNTALRRFTARNIDELPVVDATDPGRLLGLLRRRDTIDVYNRRLMEHKQLAGE